MVGMVHVAGVTLTEARTRIEEAVGGALRVSRVTVSLFEPRRFRVHVTGMVRMPGTYVVPATARAADALVMAGGLEGSAQLVAGDTVLSFTGSQRRIVLRDPSGAERRADLLLFLRGGRTASNPILHDGETIFIPRASTDNQIGVFGGVNQGGLFEYAEGDHLSDAIALAGGLNSRVDSSSLVIVGNNGTESKIDLRMNPSIALTRPINPGDRVYFGEIPDTSRFGSVTVTGEVARPGGYSIRSGETTVREILERAGGPLASAAGNSARLIRHSDGDPVAVERVRVSRQTASGQPIYVLPTDLGLSAEFSRWLYGTTVVDLSEAMKPDTKEGDIVLRDGDSLDVPKGPIGVRVLGAVNAAGEVAWQPDKKLDYYLNEAGGINRGGWKNRTVVVKARNGSQLRYDPDLPIEQGDVVYVPQKPSDKTNWDMFKDIIAVTAQVATVILVVQSIGN